MDFADDYARSAPWEKVTRKVIDPITFACTATIEYRPQLEECAFETTGPAISEPRFGDVFQRTTRKGIVPPSWSPPSSRTPTTNSSRKTAAQTQQQSPAKKGGSGSLGAFFQKSSAIQKKQEMDNMSVGSRSIASRSVADLSVAERSKSEDKLKRRAKKNKKAGRRGSKTKPDQQEMETILDDTAKAEDVSESPSEPAKPEPPQADAAPQKKKSCLSKKSKYGNDDDADNANKGNDDDDDKSLSLEDVKIEKSLRFAEGHEEFEIDRITNSMYDDLFYGSEELADFRYEAFLEEAGLDADEYM